MVEAYVHATTSQITEERARFSAHQLLRKPTIKTVIDRFARAELDAISERIELEMVQFWHSRAFWKATDIFHNDGEVKELDEVAPQALAAIDGIKVDYRGKDADRKIIHYSMANRGEAMKILADWKSKRKTGKSDTPAEAVASVKGAIERAREGMKREGVMMRTILERKKETVTERMSVEDGDSDDTEE
jgi:hypothetical protein